MASSAKQFWKGMLLIPMENMSRVRSLPLEYGVKLSITISPFGPSVNFRYPTFNGKYFCMVEARASLASLHACVMGLALPFFLVFFSPFGVISMSS